jgi:hypothetical protein
MAPQSSKPSQRHPLQRPYALSPRWQWLTGTVLALGGGGTTVAILTQEELVMLEKLGPLAAIPLLGVPVLWLIRAMFK